MAAWLPWLLLTLSVVILGVLGWYYFADEDEDEPETLEERDPLGVTAAEIGAADPLATTTEEYRGAGRKSRMIALKESLERSLDSREGVARGSARDRMVMPWFMLVGADGSGKKTVLANNGLDLPWGPPIEVDSQRKDAGKWWLYEDAVVLEAPAASPGATEGSSTLPPDQTIVDASVGWSTLLHMLRRERPDSPLNGVIVTISCTDLVDARNNPEKLEEQADRIRVFLERTRRFLGVRLPLHVIVTRCETLPGFRSFAESLPEARRQDVLGWANPRDVEARFEAAWVDAGFAELQERLGTLRDEVLAAPEQVRDSVGVFVFDSEFAELQEPLKTFIARLMTIGERSPSLFLRGFYFTGDVLEQADVLRGGGTVEERQGSKSSSRVSGEIAKAPHKLVFVKSLFGERIFREAGLARPTARFRLSRDRRVVLAQAAALVIALGGGFGLWTSLNGLHAAVRPGQDGLRADARLLTRVLSGVAIDLDALRHGDSATTSPVGRRSRDAAVIELVGQMRVVPSTQIRSPFIPTSWFSRLPTEIRASIRAGVSDIVLPVSRQRLMERASLLVGDNGTAAGELLAGDAGSLPRYLAEVRALSRNLARYNALADSSGGTFADLSALLEYLFDERIVSDSAFATPEFEQALREASAPPIPVPATMATAVVRRAASVAAAVAGSASHQLAPGRSARPADDLAALQGIAALVELVDGPRGLVETVGDSTILGVRLARLVQDSIAAQLRLSAVRIAPDTLSPDSSARRLRAVMSRLRQYRLMVPIEGRRVASQIRPNERLRWDVGSMELALSLRSEFLQAVVSTAQAFPRHDPERLQRALEIQLRRRSVDVAAASQRFTPIGVIDDPVAEIRSQGVNLDGSASRLMRLADMLDSLGAGEDAERLLASALRQAEQTVALADATLERNRYLAPDGPAIAAWRGVLPLAFAAIGAPDSLAFHSTLLRHETEVRTLAHAAAPSLRFLHAPEFEDLLEAEDLVERWENVYNAVLKYERGDLTSTMGALHRYLAGDLMVSSLAACRGMARMPEGTGPSPDFFVTRMRQHAAAVVSRCVPGGSAWAVASYERLRSSFEARLAGRYPFADSTTASRVDAVPADVGAFLRQYEHFMAAADPALRSDPAVAAGARAAFTFVDGLAPVRALLAPVAVGADHPTYGIAIAAPGIVDTLNGTLQVRVGAREMSIEESAQAVPWTPGDSVIVTLSPFDTTSARPRLAAGGWWAALRAAQRPAGLSVRLYHPRAKIEIPLPVFPSSAPAIVQPRR